MNKFDSLIESLNILNVPVVEHCKQPPYFKPYNMLQVEILKRLYFEYLKDNIEGFSDKYITDDSDLIAVYFDKLPEALRILGTELCQQIPNQKTLSYSGYDINTWTNQLYQKLFTKKD